MIKIELATKERRREYIEFANNVFSSDDKTIDFPTLLPKIYALENEKNANNYVAINEGNTIVGMAGLCPVTLDTKTMSLKCGYIGTVSVSSKERDRGIMKLLMEHVLSEARKEGYDFLFLDGTRQRYGYYGFSPAGERIKITITKSNVKHGFKDVDTEKIQFIKMLNEDNYSLEAIRLHNMRDVKFDRSLPGFSTVAKSFGGEGYLIIKNDISLGYLITDIESGEITDLYLIDKKYIKEAVAAWMNKSSRENIIVQVAPFERTLLEILTEVAENTSSEIAGKARIINYNSFISTLLYIKSCYVRLDDGMVSFNIKDECEHIEKINIRVKDNKISMPDKSETEPIILDTLEAGRLFLDPYAYSLKEKFNLNWFPLPLFIPRADCI